ncbi:N-6 DNA methylase [Crocinitomicaceae bacterium]|nr:N-6 DNA methylase [Crocinitomicaceae bacterium]
MSTYIDRYRNKINEIVEFGGSLNETSIRRSFIDLVNDFAKDKNLMLIEELYFKTPKGNTVYPDGTLKDRFRLSLGYYEAKDSKDDLEAEIEDKKKKNYPLSNTIFENSIDAVLFQNNKRAMSIKMKDDKALLKMLKSFVNFEREEIKEFHQAIEEFKNEIPKLSQWCKDEIEAARHSNEVFNDGVFKLRSQLRKEVNPDFLVEDIHEVIVQHILTNRLFKAIFSEVDFHSENNIASQIENVVKAFFTKEKKKEFDDKNKHIYAALERTAVSIQDHHEKQDFLKTLYEEFYKSYNPKEADKLGVVYTPNRIVNFMIKATDNLLFKHFNTGLAENDVNILDPATGTGTFIADIIDYLPPEKLKNKYARQLFANEVAILPYYVATLNIEYTYWQKMKEYIEFPNICFIDTLDNAEYKSNIGTRGQKKGQYNMLDSLSEENSRRMAEQNNAKISVVIGNPPYNANQKNFNDQNANRTYPKIDARIKETYKKHSKATKLKLEDMYARFYRWAMDRVDEKEGGIIAFITNRSFIDKTGYDGFRKIVSKEFDYVYIIDTKSDVRDNNKLSGTKHNVFGIQTGVAVMFLVKQPKDKQAKAIINYHALVDDMIKEEKLSFFKNNEINHIEWDRIYPDKNSNWINTGEDDFEKMIPVVSKKKTDNTIFNFYSLGVSTNRDDWVYDLSKDTLERKMQYFSEWYQKSVESNSQSLKIKWSENMTKYYDNRDKIPYVDDAITEMIYRPFIKKNFYKVFKLSDRLTANHYNMFGKELTKPNKVFHFSGIGHNKTFTSLAYKSLFSLDAVEKGQSVPYSLYTDDGEEIENVSDWALNKFRKGYKDKDISKESIFYYVLGALHSPAYREKYKDNLKLEFPRIAMNKDFWKWSNWGKDLFNLQANYEGAELFNIKEVHQESNVKSLKTIFKVDRVNGSIKLDERTTLTGIPPEAFEYQLGIRSAIDWILDQYKVKKIKDETITAMFNDYKYVNYKDEIIELIKKVTTVSIKSLAIMNEMKDETNK